MSFCLIDKVHEAWGRGYGKTTDVKSIESPGGGGAAERLGIGRCREEAVIMGDPVCWGCFWAPRRKMCGY